jgi:hypothetical protein
MNARTTKLFFGAVALAFSSCATETTAYGPMSEPQPAANQTPAASYPIPAVDPKGTAYVMSLGAEPMPTPSGTRGFFLHLRIAAENRSDAVAWIIDTRDQTVTLGGAPVQATYAEASAGGPVLTLAQGQHGTLDVFYLLPPEGGPNLATLSWKVHRGSDPVAGDTPFELVPRQSAEYIEYRPVGAAVEVWPAWWWGMGFYPWVWGPGWGYYPYWGRGYAHGGWGYHGGGWRGSGGWHGAPSGSGWRGGGGFRGGGGRGFRH